MWYCPESRDGARLWVPRQHAELTRVLRDDVEIVHGGPLRNAQWMIDDYLGRKAEECVIIAPMAALEHVIKNWPSGVRKPLWPQTEPTESPSDFYVRGQWHRFVEFQRWVALGLHTVDPRPQTRRRPARVAIVGMDETKIERSRAMLLDLYGSVEINTDLTYIVDGRKLRAALQPLPVDDLLLTAPFPIFRDLLQGNSGRNARRWLPLKAEGPESTLVLLRVTGSLEKRELFG